MKYVALAVAAVAVIGLTACSHSGAPAASSTGTPAAHRSTSVPVSCRQQYHAWQHGSGKGFTAALHAVSVAGIAGDPQALAVALKKAGPIVVRATHHPIPACADPRGYWDVLLMHVNGAVASRHSTASLQAAMKGIPKIDHNLTIEVKRLTS
ncbi:MAG: hypothetical protein J2P17_27635 [Mycobacterium sp.]|nr:hypothetical protein [Mycobacterium sp.]